MLRTPRNFLLLVVCLAVVSAGSALLLTRTSIETSASGTSAQVPAAAQVGRGSRNLFLQPEALRVSRRVGKRFDPSGRGTSVMTGTVTFDGNVQPVTITRRQSEKGEGVDMLVGGRPLTWRTDEGARAASGTATDTEQRLIERLVYDSPDYFILAQLHGASYYTVARNVRPENAPDHYDGPLWTIVRVGHQDSSEAARPKSSWRLYYINSQTGLIDRILSQLNDETVEAQITNWTEQSGEKTPSYITWFVDGRAVMSYQVSSVSHTE